MSRPMRYRALASDYDGTLAHHGLVDESTLLALERMKKSGRFLILVTGRELDDLAKVFPHLDLFDRVVAENGALLYRPRERTETVLAEPPPPEFVERLRRKGVDRLSVGRVVVATWVPHHRAAFELIQEMGLNLHVIFNKEAVMVLPSGVNKATGLAVARQELGLSRHEIVGVGDAENDHAFLAACGYSVAVGNALPSLKERVNLVTLAERGAGVSALIDHILLNQL